MLQRVALCSIVLQCVAVCCSVWQCVAVFCGAQCVELCETRAVDSDAQATLLPYEVCLYLYSASECNTSNSAATLPENLSASVAVNIKNLHVLFALTHIGKHPPRSSGCKLVSLHMQITSCGVERTLF